MDVRIACPCPPKANGEPRHEHDTVTLRERFDFRSAQTIRNSYKVLKVEDPDVSVAEVLATLTEFYLLFGVEAWTLTDDKGKLIELSKTAIREHLLTAEDVETVADAADELYTAKVFDPLVKRAQRPRNRSSRSGPMDDSTSARKSSPMKPPRPSKRSSTTTSRMGGTGTITSLHAGASSSSPSSKSVA